MMIQQSLAFIKETLNAHLKSKFELEDQLVIVNRIVDSNGDVPQINQNKIVFTLVNIVQEEKRRRNYAYPSNRESEGFGINMMSPIVYYMEILISSHFSDYDESLKFLEETLTFFYNNPLFTREENPSFPGVIDKLAIELRGSNITEMKDLWTTFGGKHQPSLFYTLRFAPN